MPGAGASASASASGLLGLLVENVTGRPLSAVLTDRVFRPAQMTHTYLPLTEQRIRGPHAAGYYLPSGIRPEQPGALREITELNPSFAWSAYGLVSDGRDVNRFFHALFSGRLLDSGTLDQMRAGVPTPQAPIFPHYGLGTESIGLTCGDYWGGTGSIPGYVTFAFSDDTGERRIVISINVQRKDPEVGRILLSGVDAVNRYFCGTPYQLPATSDQLPLFGTELDPASVGRS